jgi:hypothetical protein
LSAESSEKVTRKSGEINRELREVKRESREVMGGAKDIFECFGRDLSIFLVTEQSLRVFTAREKLGRPLKTHT